MGWESSDLPEWVSELCLFEDNVIEGVRAIRSEIANVDERLRDYEKTRDVVKHRRGRAYRAGLQQALKLLIEHNAGNDISEENRIDR